MPIAVQTRRTTQDRFTWSADEAAYLLIVAGMSLVIAITHLEQRVWDPVSVERMVQGQALTPMQYRVLIPWMFRAMAGLPGLPAGLVSVHRLTQGAEVAAVVLVFLSTRLFLGRLGLSRPHARWGSLLPGLLIPFYYLLPTTHGYYYVYDMPAVVFFTLGLAVLAEQNWVVFYPLFALATINRETICFLTLIYLLSAVRYSGWRSIARHVTAQFAVWAALKAWLWSLYGQNASQYADGYSLYKTSLDENVALIAAMGTPVLLVVGVLTLTWAPALVFYSKVGSPLVRRGLWVCPIYLAAMFYVGEFDELRIFGELMPLACAATVYAVVRSRDAHPPQVAA